MTYSSRKLYRSRNGVLLGVCQGIADWRDLPVSVVRLIFVLVGLATAVVPCLVIYLAAALFIPMEPGRSDFDDRESFRDRYRRNRRSAFDDIRDEFDNLKSRVNRMENDATSDKESDWDRRFHNGR